VSQWACLATAMQHTREQFGNPRVRSREPTHWMNTTLRGDLPFNRIFPAVARAETIRSTQGGHHLRVDAVTESG